MEKSQETVFLETIAILADCEVLPHWLVVGRNTPISNPGTLMDFNAIFVLWILIS
jgi:hypothetical protein